MAKDLKFKRHKIKIQEFVLNSYFDENFVEEPQNHIFKKIHFRSWN